MADDKKLPPIDLKEDVEKYEAFVEKKEIKFEGCRHKDVIYNDGQLSCKCGAGWSGTRLDELYRLLTS